jgi:signal transduction histidine kinase
MTAGFLVWAYTLLLPTPSDIGVIGARILTDGPWGLSMLRPQHLFGLEVPPLVHGVIWSLLVNILSYIGFSLHREPSPIERLQANTFVPSDLTPIAPSFRLWRSSVTVEELTTTIARYLGEERTRSAFETFAGAQRISLEPKDDADFRLVRYAEHILASALGGASSRLVLSLLLRKRTVSTKAALKLLDDANAAIQYNREILQTALDHVRQGIAVFDKDLQLICWNRQFGDILDLPPSLVRAGAGLGDILRFNSRRGPRAGDHAEEFVSAQLERYVSSNEPFLERFAEGMVIEVRANRMPDGGFVTTFTDITASVEAAEALERSNETLERRVRERTEELTRLNVALARAKGEADAANISKTKFLAAASHDILQPLNAARLYVTSLIERGGREDRRLIDNIDASLEAVEEIFGALLDMSRLDTGALRPEFASFRIDELMRQIELEFAPLAATKGLDLTFVPCSLVVRSDRRLLRRLLQNLVSNAIKYTPAGRVLVGCRRQNDVVRIDVYDTGVGIPQSKWRDIFIEFHRLDQGAKIARGLGLGLSIVERVARVLGSSIELGIKKRPRGPFPPSRFRSSDAPMGCRRAKAPASIPDSSPALPRFVSTTNPRFSTVEICRFAAGVVKCSRRQVLPLRWTLYPTSRSSRTACWSTITWTKATASKRSLRCAAGSATCPPSSSRQTARRTFVSWPAMKAFRYCTSRSSRRHCVRCWRNGACCVLQQPNRNDQPAIATPCGHWPASIFAAAITAWVRLSTPSF